MSDLWARVPDVPRAQDQCHGVHDGARDCGARVVDAALTGADRVTLDDLQELKENWASYGKLHEEG